MPNFINKPVTNVSQAFSSAEKKQARDNIDVYSKSEVDDIASSCGGYVVVQELPSVEEANKNKVYLVGPQGSGTDKYEEWVITDDGIAEVWTLIGETSIDLSPYDKIVDAEAREKVINDALTAHKNDSVAHITAAERTSWNGAVSNSHTHSNKAELDKIASGDKAKWDAKQDAISDLATIRSGAAAGATAVQPSSLAKVATSGNYNDLSNKPTIPAAITIDSAMSSTSTNPVQNKVVKDALDSKLPITTSTSSIVSTGTPQTWVSYSAPDRSAYLIFFDVTSCFDGSMWTGTEDKAHVAFAGFIQSCKYNGYGGNRFYKVEFKLNSRNPTPYMYSSDSGYGPCIVKRTYDEGGVEKYKWFIAVRIPANYGFGLMVQGVFHFNTDHPKTWSGTLSWADGFLGTFVVESNTEYSVQISYTAGYNWAAKLSTARSLGVNLARTAASTFDGSANQLEIPVKGSLPIANGGTGASTAAQARTNLGLGSLATKSSVADADISGTISDTHIASASKWNGKQDAIAAMTADFVNGEWDK